MSMQENVPPHKRSGRIRTIETFTCGVIKGGGVMRVLAQMVLPFKIEATDETLTANAGLVLFGEFVHGLGFKR